MSNGISRRELLQRTGLAAGLAALGGVWTEGAAKASQSPNEKLNIAMIGVGGIGGSVLNEIKSENIVALCDVDDRQAAGAYKAYPDVPKYKDFRKMLDEQGKHIDAVTVCTPDHTHAVASAYAMHMGKHVYTQKPLTHTPSEARALMLLARKMKVATQMGNQGHPFYWDLVEWLNTGVIGPVTEVHCQTDRPAGWWPQGVAKPTAVDPVPAELDFDLWLGPAASRPYNHAYLPFVWRGWWDFGTGAIGDMACHIMDGAFLSLKLKYPIWVDSEGDPRMPDSGPLSEHLSWGFPARGDMPPVTLNWYDGGRQIPTDLLDGRTLAKDFNGSLFVGSKGRLFVPHGGTMELFPKEKFADFTPPPHTLPRPEGGHYREWIDAAKKNVAGTTGTTFDYSAPMTESVLLGNVAFRTGKRIEYDWKNMRCPNAPESEQYIRHHYRKGWSL